MVGKNFKISVGEFVKEFSKKKFKLYYQIEPELLFCFN